MIRAATIEDMEARAEAAEAEVAVLRDALTLSNRIARDRGERENALREELATVLEVAIVRGDALGYDNDAGYVRRWEELTGETWRWDEE